MSVPRVISWWYTTTISLTTSSLEDWLLCLMACSADSESEKTYTAIGGWHGSLKKFKSIRMATNSAVNIDTWGSWYFLVRLLSCGTTNAAPTPSVIMDPSVFTQIQWLYWLLISSLAVACKIRGLSDFRSPATSNSTRAPSTTQGGYGWTGLRDPKSSLARIDKRTVRTARNTRYRYNQIGPLDHKMADNCVSFARTD